MLKSIEKILVDVIQHELNLPANYGTTSNGDVIPSVIIYSQNIKLFNTNKLQITVRTVNINVYSNRSRNLTNSDGTYTEIIDLNTKSMMQVDCYSRNNDARDRYWEVIAALKSDYAQQQMDLYNFKLATLPVANNISGIDGGSDINRFAITFNVLAHQQKINNINYYDKFRVTANNESGKFADIANYEVETQ